MSIRKLMGRFAITALTVGLIGTVPVIAGYHSFDDGYAYNYVNRSNGLKHCDAGTVHENGGYASLYVTTNYNDGQVDGYWSDIMIGRVHYESPWEDAADYESVHRLHNGRTTGATEICYLSED